jgi:8-oxo-dGTP pyrophosphatase MutT (NUDIX family)
MAEYVLGLAFTDGQNAAQRRVLLMKKTHPEWQAGQLNGVGGGLRRNEFSKDAMVREFQEETGLPLHLQSNWVEFAHVQCWRSSDPSVRMTCFYSFYDRAVLESIVRASKRLSPLTELLELLPVSDLPCNIVQHVRWLIPMALELVGKGGSTPTKYAVIENYR